MKSETTKINLSKDGYYGEFGGSYVPEMLFNNLEELKHAFNRYASSKEFQEEFSNLLKDYSGRPTPLYRATRLSEKYRSNIYLKREDLNHTGAHKINNTIGQILLAKRMGKSRIIAETGAGQHGVATATVCALMGLECTVFMGEIDTIRQEPNVARMKMLGAKVIPVSSGSKTLKDATNEAIRYWIANPENCFYIIGSVVGPAPYPDMVAYFQSVISEELMYQVPKQTDKQNPNRIIACVGGGSNAAGIFYHYLDNKNVELIAVEADGKGIHSGHTAATIQTGTVGIIHGSKTILMQDKNGQIIEPYSISAGLDYPGIGPLHSFLHHSGKAKYLGATDTEALEAGLQLANTEGIIPALESAHALAVLEKIPLKKTDITIVCLSGRGDKDLHTYMSYLDKKEKTHEQN